MAGSKYPPITFEYIKSHDYKVHHVHGGIGGPNAYGEIILNLYFERNSIPRKATHKIDDNGRLDNNAIDVEKKNSIIRDVLFGISLHPEHARSLAQWLNDCADSLDKKLIIKEKKK